MPSGCPIVTLSPVPKYPVITDQENEAFQEALKKLCDDIVAVDDRIVVTWTRARYEWVADGELVDRCELVFFLGARGGQIEDPGPYREALEAMLVSGLEEAGWTPVEFTGEVGAKGFLLNACYRGLEPDFIDLRERGWHTASVIRNGAASLLDEGVA
jgi:hypothetical protein